jgi:glutamate--cysteine ligase
MMRHTASLQINLDLGGPDLWRDRWLAANLISPLITASFACSPGAGGVSTRARAWQELDPTRSGFPTALVDGTESDPRIQWAEAAMAADVMLFKTAGGKWYPGDRGFNFERWVRHGHPEYGWPTAEDLEYHLTTLFFEVRPRGFIELRAGEQMPDCLRAAQIVLVVAAIYDDDARSRVLEILADRTHDLPDLWRRAAAQGVGDAELRNLAVTAWQAALEGVERIGGDQFGECAISCARRFVEEYTGQGRSPADRLRELQAEDPALSLRWASSVEG